MVNHSIQNVNLVAQLLIKKINKKEINPKKNYIIWIIILKKLEISLQNREQKNSYQREYYQLNKDKIFEKEKERYNNNIQFRLSKIYRNRLNSYIKSENDNMKYLKCTLMELKNFIEVQFIENMSWNNKGDIWELDHVIPISKFNLELPEHVETCFHWTNLKPIYKSENRIKSNKIFEKIIKSHREFSFNYNKTHKLHYIDIYNFFIFNFKISK
jgi:hypothetical protein